MSQQPPVADSRSSADEGVVSADRGSSSGRGWATYAIGGVFLALIGMRLAALVQIPLVGDEPNDLYIIFGDVDGLLSFFSSPWMYELDQARLQFFVSYPILYIFGYESPVPLRLFFLIFHLAYLFVSFRLAMQLTHHRARAIAYSIAIATSCYLAAFSIFYITTSDNLFLLLHVSSMYLYVKSSRSQDETGVFSNYVGLAWVMGLMIASKLFGVLLLAAILVHHLLSHRGPTTIRSVRPTRLIQINAIFLAAILAINLVPMEPLAKTLVALAISTAYVGVVGRIIWRERSGRFASASSSWLGIWSAIVLTSFSMTLVFSPVYLNLRNLPRILEWFDTWPRGLLVAKWHLYDILVIILMKLGLFSTLSILVVGLIAIWSRIAQRHIEKRYLGGFFALVFLIQFTVNSISRFHVAWYPVAIFPLLFLFVICTWDRVATGARTAFERRMATLIAVCLAVIVIDNTARQIRWFPYSHFDGAQYGTEYISWNRAGFVTFESVTPVFDYFRDQGSESPRVVDIKMVEVPEYNDYAATFFDEYAKIKDLEGFTFTNLTPDSPPADFLLTSPIYNAPLEARLRDASNQEFVAVETISLKGIEMATIWQPRIP